MVAIAALVSTFPMLIAGVMGSELQRPMALALMGGMSLGTVVSLCSNCFYRKDRTWNNLDVC